MRVCKSVCEYVSMCVSVLCKRGCVCGLCGEWVCLCDVRAFLLERDSLCGGGVVACECKSMCKCVCGVWVSDVRACLFEK